MLDLGMVKPGGTIYLPFDTFGGTDGESITMTGLAVGDIKIYKDGDATQRASTSGFTLLDTDGIDFDGITGVHGVSIDLSDNTTASFYEAGSRYFIAIDSITIDSQTVSFVAATFTIGYNDAILNTTIATLASQTSFTLEEGSGDNDAYNNCPVLIHDLASAVQVAIGYVSDYTGSTKTVTLAVDPGIFTMAAGDSISIFMPSNLGPTALTNVNAEVDTAFIDYDPPTYDELLAFIQLLARSDSAIETDRSSELSAINTDEGSGAGDYSAQTDSGEAIRDRGDSAWTTGGGSSITDILNVQPLIPNAIDLAGTATWRMGLMIFNALDDLPSIAEITPGTISIDRKAIGDTSWTSVVSDAACSEAAGVIYYDEVFDSGSGYAEGDSIRITLKSQKITVSANDYEITDSNGQIFYTYIRETERGTDSAAVAGDEMDLVDAPNATAVTAIQNGLATPGDEMDIVDAPNSTGLAAFADALLTRDWTSVTGEAARSVLNALRLLRNKWSVSGTTLTVTEEDDSTTAWTGAVTDNSNADPITGVDPS